MSFKKMTIHTTFVFVLFNVSQCNDQAILSKYLDKSNFTSKCKT